MEDFLYRGLLPEHAVRFSYALTTGIGNQAVLAHDCDPVAAQVLCRALGAGVMCAPLLDGDERFTLRWNYEGALRNVVVDVGAAGDVRGFLAPTQLADSATVDELYGASGQVAVIKSVPGRTLNSGVATAGMADVVDDLEQFFSTSEQLETAMTVMVGFQRHVEQPVALCQGLMLQALPGCDLERFAALRARLDSPNVRDLLAVQPRIDNHFELIVQALVEADRVGPDLLRIFAAPPPAWRCHCDRERVRDLLLTLPADERQAMVAGQETVRIHCQFCAKAYDFTAAELAALDS